MNIQRFGILLFPGVEELDFVGPWEMLRMWSLYADGPSECLLVAQRDAPVECAKGMRVLPDHDFAGCPPLDALLVPGGKGTRDLVGNAAVLDFVRTQAAGAQLLMSVCTGAFVLHAAGLLAGRSATTYWSMLPALREVLRHYSELDENRLHADGEAILVPLRLSEQETEDLLAFLDSLNEAPAPRQ